MWKIRESYYTKKIALVYDFSFLNLSPSDFAQNEAEDEEDVEDILLNMETRSEAGFVVVDIENFNESKENIASEEA